MLQFAASDLGLHCLPMYHKKGARLIWINVFLINYYDISRPIVFFNMTTFKALDHSINFSLRGNFVKPNGII